MHNKPVEIVTSNNKISRCALCNEDILPDNEHYVLKPIEIINNGQDIHIHVSCLDNNIDIAWEEEDE